MKMLEDIYNYKKVNEALITGGQPSEAQLREVAQAGFQMVVNLLPFQPGHSLAGEEMLVRSLGMDYHNIPVQWMNPTLEDFDAFEKLLEQAGDQKLFIHCAANYRVTAFYSLYARKHLGWSKAQAEEFRRQVWQDSDYPAWEQFIQEVEAKIASSLSRSG